MNEFLQLAESLKYSSEHGCKISELRSGLFALYNCDARVLYVGESWDEVLEHFRNRPKYKVKPRIVVTKSGIDLSKLEINI